MNVIDALREAEHQLSLTGTDTPLLEAEVLLRYIYKISRAQLYMSLQEHVSEQEWQSMQDLMNRRLQGEPVAYITATKEFYNLELHVDRRVLIPRPETEILVDEALVIAGGIEVPVILDIGTGSGAIAIAIAYNNPSAELFAVDLSLDCLDVAAKNVQAMGLEGRIKLLHGNLLEPLASKADIICANLPYVKHAEIYNHTYEPLSSLDGGHDGLEIIKELIREYEAYLNPGGKLLIEIGDGQEAGVQALFDEYAPSAAISNRRDLAGIVRLIIAGCN